MSKSNCLLQVRWLGDVRFKHCIREEMTLSQYAMIALKMSVLPIQKRLV